MATKKAKSAGTITDKDLYSIEEFKQRCGVGGFALFLARLNGLRVLKFDGKKFILGRDFISYLESRSPKKQKLFTDMPQSVGTIPACPRCKSKRKTKIK